MYRQSHFRVTKYLSSTPVESLAFTASPAGVREEFWKLFEDGRRSTGDVVVTKTVMRFMSGRCDAGARGRRPRGSVTAV